MTAVARWWDLLQHWLLDERRGSYGLAVMRMIFGGMTVVLLLMYLPDFSYSFGEGSRWGESMYVGSAVNDYIWPISVLFSRDDGDAVLLVKVFVLIAVAVAYAIGWRMRIVSPLFLVLLLGFATMNPQLFATGHHQTLRIMLIFLLLADTSRVWSLDARRRRLKGDPAPLGFGRFRVQPWFPVLANNVAVILVGAQVCIIYVSSALWKLQGPMWHDGSAVYYTLRVQELALFPWLNNFLWHVTPLVVVATFAAVYGQLLFPVLLLNRWTRIAGLIIVTGMHFAIGILLALPWFSLMMIACDMLFIRTRSWRWLADWVRPRADRIRTRASGWISPRGSKTDEVSTADKSGGVDSATRANAPDDEPSPVLTPVAAGRAAEPEAVSPERREMEAGTDEPAVPMRRDRRISAAQPR